MSRPSSSVPHQCADDGGERRVGRSIYAGSCGEIHGANIAQITKTMTNTAPVAASGLWRAARGSEMERVDTFLNRITTVLGRAAYLREMHVRNPPCVSMSHPEDGCLIVRFSLSVSRMINFREQRYIAVESKLIIDLA